MKVTTIDGEQYFCDCCGRVLMSNEYTGETSLAIDYGCSDPCFFSSGEEYGLVQDLNDEDLRDELYNIMHQPFMACEDCNGERNWIIEAWYQGREIRIRTLKTLIKDKKILSGTLRQYVDLQETVLHHRNQENIALDEMDPIWENLTEEEKSLISKTTRENT